MSELARFKAGSTTPVALIVGSDGNKDGMALSLAELRASGAKVTMIFLDASTPTLVRRYGDTKRRHPLLADIGSVEDSIEEERRRMQGVRAAADMILDTTDLNVHDLRKRVVDLFAGRVGEGSTQITIMSFGFKHGVPSDVDMVLDCRFLPNPHWIEELRPMTGLDTPVQEYVASFDLTKLAVERIESLLELLIPAYVDEGKSVLTIAFGCTGGRHRSVAIAEQIAAWMRGRGLEPLLRHRDVEK